MAKKRTKRDRPTLKEIGQLRSQLAWSQNRLVMIEAKLADLGETAATENALGTEYGNKLTTARGLLPAVLDESKHHSILTNRIREFLGRGGKEVLPSRIELVLASRF